MQIYKQPRLLRAWHQGQKAERKTLAMVPTMGALHQGHLSLVRQAQQVADEVLVSIFVNPTQFNDPSDLESYPRTLEQDLAALKTLGVSAVFTPSQEGMYPAPPTLSLSFGELEKRWEGAQRPGHFSGVGLVVSKLLNMAQPDFAFFGQKDLQQFRIIEKLVEETALPVELHMAPIAREESGLALSSRNQRLSEAGRKEAAALFANLKEAKAGLEKGLCIAKVERNVEMFFEKHPNLYLEYFAVVDSHTLLPKARLEDSPETALLIAASTEGVRLLDNLLL